MARNLREYDTPPQKNALAKNHLVCLFLLLLPKHQGSPKWHLPSVAQPVVQACLLRQKSSKGHARGAAAGGSRLRPGRTPPRAPPRPPHQPGAVSQPGNTLGRAPKVVLRPEDAQLPLWEGEGPLPLPLPLRDRPPHRGRCTPQATCLETIF